MIRLLSALALALLLLPQTARAEDPIGHVRKLQGAATAAGAGGATRPLALGDPVFRLDALMTGEQAALGITFKDGTLLSLGPNTRVELTGYAFEPARDELSFVARLLRGTLVYVSGVIAKLSPDAVTVETPVATVAVRGTRFLARAEP